MAAEVKTSGSLMRCGHERGGFPTAFMPV